MSETILYCDYIENPEYLYDNIFHNSRYCSKINILTNIPQKTYSFLKDLNFYNHVEIHDLKEYRDPFLKCLISEPVYNFREGFWIKTINRYFEIYNFLKKTQKTNIFHMENDILLFTPLQYIFNFLVRKKDSIYICKDSKTRALGSLLYIPNFQEMEDLCLHFKKMLETGLEKGIFYNDMEILGKYNCESLPTSPNKNGIIDACCFGQSLGGVDKRNNPKNTEGFVNETSNFKPEKEKINLIENNWYYELCKLHSLHIHSKELWKYIPYRNLKIEDIFQVDRITKYPYYRDIDYESLKDENCIYIKTDFQKDFLENYLPLIKKEVNLFFGNCDRKFDLQVICDNPFVKNIYCMNPGIIHSKIIFLPVGLANNNWSHGQKDIFYDIYLQSRKWKKTKKIFISFNENTFCYRKQLKKSLELNNFKIQKFSDQKDFWKEMAKYKYVFCPRGNGFDTHRFWEALWLGCVPVIINNKNTSENEKDYDNFVYYLRNNNYNFYEIIENDTDKIINILENLK